MNLPKIRASFAAIAAAIAYIVAPSASAAILATNNFETACDGFTADIGTVEEAAVRTNYGTYPSGDAPYDAPYPFSGTESTGFGSKYLAVDTGDATIFREFATQTSSTYLDTFMQFEPTTGEISYTNAAKIVVYLDAATSNLCVISGTSADNRTPVTNRLTSAVAEPGTWGRLTIKCLSGDVFSFQVLLNGAVLSTAGSVDTFYSLKSGATVSRVGFKGTGALDDFVARTTDPYIAPGDIKATYNGESYATVEQALDEANGAQVTLAANHPGTVAVTKSGTYVVDKGSYTFGGVVGTEGSYVSPSTSDNVITYNVKLLVAVWDGATAAYDFSTLTRTVGDNTYTLNLNPQNSVEDNGSYVQIGPNNAQKGVALTVQNLNPTVTNGFGTAGAVTVLMKCSGIQSSNANRLLIGILDSGIYGNDNSVKVGLGTRSDWGGAIFEWQGAYHSQINQVIAPDEQTVALTYNSNDGTAFFVDGERIGLNSGLKSMYFTTPCGISLGGPDSDSGSKFYAMSSMKISAIAVFSSTLTTNEVAAYTFPSETPMSGEVDVSEINTLFGTKSEINVYLADGTTITGDTTFNATTVHFICDGSFTMKPPAGNTATFDFSTVTGQAVLLYESALPSVSGDVFTSTTIPTWVTDAEKWTGTVWLRNITGLTEFEVNPYGNESSVVRLTGIKGWLKAPGNYAYTNAVPVELINTGSTLANNYALQLTNGNSANSTGQKRCTLFKKLIGSGSLAGTDSATTVVVVIQDASEFTGDIYLNNKIVVFGDGIPDFSRLASGKAFVMQGKTITIRSGYAWKAPGGIEVDGELRAGGLSMFEGDTSITTTDTGVFTLINSNNTRDEEVDYARITGTGTLRYADVSGKWRTLSMVNFPTNMVCENNLSEGLILQQAGAIHTIGSLAGSGSIRSDWGSGNRDLRILQARDTTYSGVFHSDDRIGTVTVAPGTSSAGTLTLSNTQTVSNDLVIESGAKVNITGTWVGAVTVNGTLGGTGTITGNVTLSDGAKLKVNDISDLLSVTGLTISGTVNIDLPEGTAFNTNTKFLTTSSKPTITAGTKFNVSVGGVRKAVKVSATNDGLRLSLAPIVFLL